jgi:hypothetical protein
MGNVLDPYFLTEVVRNIRTDINSFRGAQLLTGGVDLKTELGLSIEYDVTYDATGMTPPTGLNDPSPVNEKTVVDHVSFTNQEWREKMIIDREKIAKLRAPGSKLEEMWGEQYMIECMVELNQRLETRFEWQRFKALSGSLIIPATKNKPSFTIDYKVPSGNKPTAAILWTDTENAKPLVDINGWKLKFRGTGARPVGIICNQKTDNLLRENASIQNLLRTTYGKDILAADSLKQVMSAQLNGMWYEVYDGGYIDETGTFNPFIPDNVCIIVGEGMTGNIMDLVTSPDNYEDIFKGQPGKFALAKEIAGDPVQWNVINGAIVLPRMKHVNWHVYATVG